MTLEELKRVPFKMGGHVQLKDEHQTCYYNVQYGFNMVDITKMKYEGMVAGRTHREYYYKGKWYKKLDKFLEAIKDVEYKEEEQRYEAF